MNNNTKYVWRMRLRKLNQFLHSRFGFYSHYPKGIDILDQDWDNLIILDAGRADAINKQFSEVGEENIYTKISRGSQTPEWWRANFQSRVALDVVYVTAMPMPYKLGQTNPDNKDDRWSQYNAQPVFHDMIHIWNEKESNLDLPGVPHKMITHPDRMSERVVEVSKDFPKKRLIAHYSQPHLPFLGSSGRELHEHFQNPWRAWLKGDLNVDVEYLREAYYENVKIVAKSVLNIIEDLPGKTVITADHGELLYERASPIPINEILHPNKMWVPELVEVPWIEIHKGKRKKVVESPATPGQYDLATDEDEVEERLKQLGYI